jgi:hypothetical protein
MTKCICVASTSSSHNTGLSEYLCIGDSEGVDATSAEVGAQMMIRSAGTFSNLSALIPTNTSSTITTGVSRIGGVNGSMSISIGASTTGEFTDANDSDAVVSGNLYNFLFSSPSGTGSYTPTAVNAVWQSTTPTIKKLAQFGSTPFNGTCYMPLFGTGFVSSATGEATIQLKSEIAGTLENFYAYCGANTNSSTASTAGSRIGGSNGNLSISIPASATGAFEDQFSVTGHNDSISTGTTINYVGTCATGKAISLRATGVDFISSGNTWLIGAMQGTLQAASAGTTYYNTVGGTIAITQWTTESLVKLTSRLAFQASNLGCVISSNSVTGASTVALRQNGSTTALSASVTGSTTGIFEDTTHTVTIAATDQINYIITCGAGGTTLKVGGIWMVGYVPPATFIGSEMSNIGYYGN